LPSAFLDTNSPLTLCWPLLLKPFDTQDRIYCLSAAKILAV
jgi:hypothetical protein